MPTETMIRPDIDTLHQLNRDYINSVQTSDVRRFDEILAEDFLCSNPDGSLVDRAGFLAQTARPVTISNLEAHDVRVRIMGDVAIIHARTTYTLAGWPGGIRPLHRRVGAPRGPLARRVRPRDALLSGAPAPRALGDGGAFAGDVGGGRANRGDRRLILLITRVGRRVLWHSVKSASRVPRCRRGCPPGRGSSSRPRRRRCWTRPWCRRRPRRPGRSPPGSRSG